MKLTKTPYTMQALSSNGTLHFFDEYKPSRKKDEAASLVKTSCGRLLWPHVISGLGKARTGNLASKFCAHCARKHGLRAPGRKR